MDPRLIARNANLRDNKRPASRSPDGPQPRKLPRPDPPRGSPAAASPNGGSRRSSVSSGTPRRPSIGMPTPNSRNASVQLNNQPAKELEGLFVNSPDSRGSQHEDAPSGRSTPQHRLGVGSKLQNVAPKGLTTKNGATDVATRHTTSTFSNSILELLVNFSTQVSAQASLQLSHNQASARMERAQDEHRSNRKQFSQFPAIKERKSANLSSAESHLRSITAELNKHQAQQSQLIERLATLIDQSAAVQPQAELSADAKDLVSRADHETLQMEYNDLQSEVAAVQSALKAVKHDFTETKTAADEAASLSNQIPELRAQIQGVEKDTKALQEWKSVTENSLNTVNNRLSNLTGVADAARRELKSFKADEMKKLSTAQKELQTEYDTLTQNVAGLQKTSTELEKNVSQVKAAKVASNINQAPAARASAEDVGLSGKVADLSKKVADLGQNVGKILEEGPALYESVAVLNSITKGDEDEKLDAPVDENSSLKKKLHHLCLQSTSTSDAVNSMMKSVNEDGKPSVIKRLKDLDEIVNNHSTQIENKDGTPVVQRVKQLEQGMNGVQHDLKAAENFAKEVASLLSTIQRVNQLEKDQKAMKEDCEQVRAAKSTLQPQQTYSFGTVDLQPLQGRMDQLANDLKNDREAQDEKDNLLHEYVNEQLVPLHENLAAQESARLSDIESFKRIIGVIRTTLENLEKTLGKKVDSVTFETFQATFSYLQEDVKKMKTAQQKARAPSQTPTPGPSTAPPFGATRSPQLTNGVAGSSMYPMGLQPRLMHNNSPHTNAGMAPPPAAPIQALDIGRMQGQMDGLVGALQHLKQRYDNLTTDEIARQMVDQFSSMYPEAKTFNLCSRDMSRSITILNEQLEILKTATRLSYDQVRGSLDGVKKDASAADAEIASVRKMVEDVGKDAMEARKLKPDVESLKKEMGRVSQSPGSASVKTVSCDHSLLATKAEFKKADARLAAVETKTSEHDGILSKGEKEINEMRGEMKGIQKGIGAVEGKVRALLADEGSP